MRESHFAYHGSRPGEFNAVADRGFFSTPDVSEKIAASGEKKKIRPPGGQSRRRPAGVANSGGDTEIRGHARLRKKLRAESVAN